MSHATPLSGSKTNPSGSEKEGREKMMDALWKGQMMKQTTIGVCSSRSDVTFTTCMSQPPIPLER